MLSQAHRRSIHTSLTPVLGEEETDALMAEFPASESDMPATRTDLALAVTDLKTDLTLAVTDLKIAMKEQEAVMHRLFRQMAMWMVGVIAASLVGGMALAAAVGG